LFSDFENFSVLKPAAMQEQAMNNLLEQLIPWTNALKMVRNS
jgi:hypothetical protein